MIGPIFRWALAFACTSSFAAVLLLPGPPPGGLSDVDLELVLHSIREGDLHALKGDLASARVAWAAARERGEGIWPVHEGLADSYARAKLHDEALRECETALRLVPETLAGARREIVFRKLRALEGTGREADALTGYLGMPNAPFGDIVRLGVKLGAVGVDIVRRRAEVHDSAVFLALNRILDRLDRKGEAAEALARYAMAVAPWNETLNRQAVEALRAAKKTDLAVEVCRAWARAEPQGFGAYTLMGDLLWEADRKREALVAYSSIVDVRPGDAGAHRTLGEIYQRVGRADEAIAQFEAARRARPEDQPNYLSLIALYDGRGEAARAEDILIEACRRFGSAGEFRVRLMATTQDRIAKLRAEGKTDEVRALRRKLAELNVPEAGLFDLKIIMTWDARSDVDMDVIEPGGEEVNHGHAHSRAGGHYYVDNTTAFGPETYTLPKAAPGTYRIGAHLHGDVRSTVKFTVILFEDTPREERREETIILEKGGAKKFIKDVVIAP